LIHFSGLAKKTFSWFKKGFSFKKFLHRSDLAGLVKKHFRSKNIFRSKWSFLLKMSHFCSFSAHFWSFWLHFGLKKVFAFERFFWFKKLFRSNRAGLAKKLFERKNSFERKSFLNEKLFGSKNKKLYFRTRCIWNGCSVPFPLGSPPFRCLTLLGPRRVLCAWRTGSVPNTDGARAVLQYTDQFGGAGAAHGERGGRGKVWTIRRSALLRLHDAGTPAVPRPI
jgi:hypothetical protein